MIEIQKFIQRNSRRLLAVSALGIALLLVLTTGARGPQGYGWEVVNVIPAQAKLSAADISLVRVDLGSLSSQYFGKGDLVLGHYATHDLRVGTLIGPGDISQRPNRTGIAFLPIGLLATDISSNIQAGDFVDVYLIPKDQSTSPALVVSRVEVAQLDAHSRSLGGSVDISLNLTPSQAITVIDAESQGRLVVAVDAL